MKTMSRVQKQVQQTIDRLVESGAERGIQVAAYKRGELVVDAVAGTADRATGRLVQSDTPFYNFSIVKGAAATLAHMLVERGLFGYDTRVVDLWPEFSAHGKQKVTVRQVLCHSAGVPAIPLSTTMEDLCDWNKMCAVIADSELWWEPGTQVGYHAYTFGYLVGEIIRRATGKPISQVLMEEVSGPLGVGDETTRTRSVTWSERSSAAPQASRSRRCCWRRCRAHWALGTSSTSACRSRNSTGSRGWRTRRAKQGRWLRCRQTFQCSGPGRCR